MIKHSIAMAIALSAISYNQTNASDYDMDCKVILCLPSMAMSDCSDARSYMLKRLKKGKPPFGFCTGSNISSTASFASLPYCQNGKSLYRSSGQSRNDRTVCAQGIRAIGFGHNGEELYGVSQPKYYNFSFFVDGQDGTKQHFYGNYNTGSFVQTKTSYQPFYKTGPSSYYTSATTDRR